MQCVTTLRSGAGCFWNRPTRVLKWVDQFRNELTNFETSWPVLKRVDQFRNELSCFETSWPVSKQVDPVLKRVDQFRNRLTQFLNIYVASYSSCAILLLDPIAHCDQSHDYIIATAGPHMNCGKVHLAREGSCCVNAVFIWLIAMSVLCAAG